jgi:CubicO group peptidase (beta-lactamase class C family)
MMVSDTNPPGRTARILRHRPYRLLQWRGRTGLLAVVLVCLLVAACSGSDDRPATATNPPAGAVGRQRVDPELARQLQTHFGASRDAFGNRRAFLVSVDGELAVEHYHHSAPDMHLNVQDVGRSIMSTLIGIALDEGRLRSLDQTLAELLPTYRDDMARGVEAITLGQLLTLTPRLVPKAFFYPDVWGTDHDWVRRILTVGQIEPGFVSDSTGSHLLSAILRQATGRSVLAYARDKLFTPLGIDTTPAAEPAAAPEDLGEYRRAGFAWPTDPQGHHLGIGGQKLTARDLVKLGQLWLDEGRWGGRQLVSAAWIKDATTSHATIPTQDGFTYGYGFWVFEAAGHDGFGAAGDGGQMIEVVPDLGLVVVVQSRSSDDPTDPTKRAVAGPGEYKEAVDHVVIPAISP